MKRAHPKKQQVTTRHEAEPSRRNFLTHFWLGLGIFAIIEFIWVVIAFLKPRKSKANGDSGGIVTVGAKDEFPLDSVTAIRRGDFFLARLGNGEFLALSCKCTHLGCTVIWDSEKKRFECPCHASAFDITGEVLSPPASRALEHYKVIIENKTIKVDTGKRIQRKRFTET